MFSPKLPLFFFLSLLLSGGAIATNCAFTVTIIPNQPLTVCSGTTVSLTADSSVAQAGYKYAWAGGETTSVINVTTSGNYTVTVSNTGCNASVTATATVTLSVNPNPTAAISPTIATICNGQNATLTASGGVTYSWSNSLGTNPTVSTSPSSTTTYSVTVTDVNSCSATTSRIVTVKPTPSAAITGGNNAVCPGISTALTASGGGTYLWSNSLGTNSIVTVSPPTTSNYTVTVTAANGCTASATKTVLILPKPDASIADYSWTTPNGPFRFCGGGIYDLTVTNSSTTLGTNLNYSINWGDSSPVLFTTSLTDTGHTYSAQGYFTITLIVTGSNNCQALNTYTVYNGSNPAVPFQNPGSSVGICVPFLFSVPSVPSNNPTGTIYIVSKNDGTPNDTLQNPPPANYTHLFTYSSCGASGGITPNTFYVNIRAQNPCGFSDLTIQPITTSIKPIAKFTISPDTIDCINTIVTFTNRSIAGISVDNFGNCDSTTKRTWIISPNVPVGNIVSGSLGNPNPTNNPNTWGSNSLGVSFSNPGAYSVPFIPNHAIGRTAPSYQGVCLARRSTYY